MRATRHWHRCTKPRTSPVKLRNVGLTRTPTVRLVSESGREAQAQSRTVRMCESMPGTGPRACLAPLPYTPFRNHHVVFRHTNLRCDRQVLQHRSMVTSGKGPRPLEEGARAARAGTRHVLGRSVLHCLRGACRSCWQRRCGPRLRVAAGPCMFKADCAKAPGERWGSVSMSIVLLR